jgi:O-antigen/teichoic acid export membrane protein
MLRALYQSPALRAAAAFGLAGAAFTIGNLILARVFSAQQFALISLVIGVISVSGPTAPLGLDLVIARRGLSFTSRLRTAVLASSVAIAMATACIAAALYGLSITLLSAIFLATAAVGVSQATAAHFQGRRQFAVAVPYLQMSNWALVPVAIVSAAFGFTTALVPCALIALAALITASVGWRRVAKLTEGDSSDFASPTVWREAISLMAINTASTFFLALERLVIPMTVGIEHLALFGVAVSLVGSPFRMIQGAISFTIIPRLREAKNVEERRHLLLHEFILIGTVLGPACIAIWIVAPFLAHWFLGGRYDLSSAIIVAMLISGILKVLSSFSTSVVNALASGTGLRLLSASSWVCVVLAALLAYAGRSWGLCGVIYGIALGWLARCAVAFWISAPLLRR